MNKYLINKLFIITVILILLTSCGNKIISENDSANKENQTKMSDTFNSKHYKTSDSYGVAPSVLKNDDSPRPKENHEWIKKLSIKYPQLYNMEDTDKEERINDMLFQEALNIRDVLNDRDYIEYNIDYEIMEANDEILSILFTGFIHFPQKSNSFAFSATIKLTKEKFMDLSEFYKIDKNFVEKHLHKDFNVIENSFDNLNENDPYVKEYVNDYSKNTHQHDFYVKNGTLGLIIPGPQEIGYILIEGKYQNN